MQKKMNIYFFSEGNYLVLSYNKENEEERTHKIIEYVQNHNLAIRRFFRTRIV